MGGEWNEITLGDFVTLQRGHDLPETNRIEGGVPVLGSFGITGWHNESRAKGPGVTIGRSGASFGVVSYSPVDYWPLNTALYVKNFHGNDPKFAFYFLKTLDFKRYNTGSAQPSLNRNHIHPIPITIPELQEQKSIAHILGTLDDKIELNRQMNATLESMAQALFKSWFVDFDPVIDNALAAGNPIPEPLHARAETRKALGDKRKPLPEAVQKQFPSRFVFSEELGWVPEGWGVRAIGESFHLLGGHSFKSGEYVDDGHYGVVTIRNVQDGCFVQECANRITDLPPKMKEYCRLATGDVLLSLTGNVGRVCMVSEGPYLLNQRVSKIVGVDEIPSSFAYFFFRQNSLYEMMITIAKGTAQQNLSPIETVKLKQVLPGNQTLIDLSEPFEGFFKRIVGNTTYSQTLTKLRDILLPQLLSGQLRILDAEKLVAGAV